LFWEKPGKQMPAENKNNKNIFFKFV